MKTAGAFALVLALVAAHDSTAGTAADGEDLPITKVIKLLEGMKKELSKEFEEDKDLYEELKCWCDKAKDEKEHAVAWAKDHMDVLLSDVMTFTAHYKAFELDIKNTQESYKVTNKALDQAIVLDAKQKKEYETEIAELLTNIGLLKGAIVALSNNGYALTQGQAQEKVQQMLPGLRKLVHEHLEKLSWMDDGSKDVLKNFLDASDEIYEPDPVRHGGDDFLQLKAKLPVHKSYAPQSSQIFGILKQMLENFEKSVPEIQDGEKRRAEAFSLLKGSKEAELKQYLEEIKRKTKLWSELGVKVVDAKADLKATKTAYSVDVAFLSDLGLKCQTLESDWARRKKLRTEEIAAVSKAIAILSEDVTLDAQAETFAPESTFFLQMASSSPAGERARGEAAKALQRFKRPEVLLLLAMLGKNDPFDKIFKAIDDLLVKLKQDQADEVEHRDYCIDELHQADVEQAAKEPAVEKLTAEMEELTNQRKTTEKEISELHDSIALMQSELQRAGEDRVRENIEYQKTVAAQMQVQMALGAAYEKLAEFYHKPHAAMIQRLRAQAQEAAMRKLSTKKGGHEAHEAAKGESLFWATKFAGSKAEVAFWATAEKDRQAQETPPKMEVAPAPKKAEVLATHAEALATPKLLQGWLDDPQTLDQKSAAPAFLQKGHAGFRDAGFWFPQKPPAMLQSWLDDEEPTMSSSSTSVTKTTEVVVDESILGERKVATVDKPGPPTAGEAPLDKFEAMGDYEVHSGGTPVTTIIQKLIGDAKVLEVQATHDEQTSEEQYQTYLSETNKSIEQASKEITEKVQLVADLDHKKTEAKQDQMQLVLDLEALSSTVAALHKECDYLLKNFETRQTKRSEEMDALHEVVAILHGAKTP